MSHEVLLELGFLTEEERDIINSVISKDVEIRKQEQSRISKLRYELDLLKEKGLAEDEVAAKNDDYCARCQTYFGALWNRGAVCPRCTLNVCKVCRVHGVDDGWICTLCAKVREVKAQSGAWFFQGHKEKGGNVFGSMLVRKSLRRRDSSIHDNAEGISPSITEDKYGDDFANHNHFAEQKRDTRTNNAIISPKSDKLYSDDQYSDDSSPILDDEFHSIGTASDSRNSKDLEDEPKGMPVAVGGTPGKVMDTREAESPVYQSADDFDDEHYKSPYGKSAPASSALVVQAATAEATHEDETTGVHRGAQRSKYWDTSRNDEVTKTERKSSDAYGENESSTSENSGYVTPTPSDGAQSRSNRHPSSLSGDEQAHTEQEERDDQKTPIITTCPASKTSPKMFEYDEDISFHKYEMGLDNRKLKDQLSLGSRESIASYYSNAGGEVYGNYPVTGEIYFGLKYDADTQEFSVQVHQARGIAIVDEKHQTSDPYVKTYLLPDRTRGGKRKTKVKKNTINPVFDEILTYKITFDDLIHRTLWLAVWNHDRFGHNDFLGEVLIPVDEYRQSGFSLDDPEPQWYHLCERQPEDEDLSYNGELIIALKYVPPSAAQSSKKKKKKKKNEPEKGELHVNIIEATSLLAKDSNGFSDPFCKSYLLPDKSKKTKQKTPVVKKSLNPKWNYQFVYDNVTHEDLMDRVLELTVWDHDRGSSNEFLGGARLGLGAGLQQWDDANAEEQAAWNKMLNNHNNWNRVTVTLRDNMGNNNRTFGSQLDVGSMGDLHHDNIQANGISPPATPVLPDEELMIRHSEYHRKPESRIVAAMKASEQRSASFTAGQTPAMHGGDKQLTLAELAKLTRKTASLQDKTSPLSSPSQSTHVSTPDISVDEEPRDNGELVRHSEFYKVSKHPPAMPRRSVDLARTPSLDRLEERRPTLVDMLQKVKDDEDSTSLASDNDSATLKIDQNFMGSMGSVYSADVSFSDNTVSGEISIAYQYLNGMFVIKVYAARGLTAIDKNKNTSDPYVKVYLLPDQSRAGKRKTKTKHGTLDPEFNEELLFKLGSTDLLTRTLWLTVWNYDRFGRNEFLGEVRIPLEKYDGKPVPLSWYSLSEMLPGATSENHGEIVVALMFAPASDKKKKKAADDGKLHVKIIEARNLIGKDSNNLSDPFCKCYLLPDEGRKTKRKTPVLKRNLNPRWNHKFSYDHVSLHELRDRVLELTVWDHDLGSSNDFLGGVRIGAGTGTQSWQDSEGKEATLWNMLLSKANTWTEGVLPLRSQMGSHQGSLKT